MKKILILIAVVSVGYAVWPLFGARYIPTHDGEYHIIRIVEFAKMLSRGYIVPRWAPDLNNGYGVPLFNYFYPLPSYVGSLVRAFTGDAVRAFQMSVGLGYIALAAGAYLWLTLLFGAIPALVGTIVAAFTPYVFVDMYVRGSIGEVWAIAIVFWFLWAAEKKRTLLLAVTYGLLILAHNILALVFTPFVIGYLVVRERPYWQSLALGLALSAFFWLPAIAESGYVVGLNTVNFREYFTDLAGLLIPSWGTGFSGAFTNPMSTQIGVVPLAVIAGAMLTRKRTKLQLFFLVSAIIALFLTLPWSGFLWEIAKPLQLVQYPWRFLSFVVPAAGFFAASWVSRIKRAPLGIIVAAAAVLASAGYARPVTYAPRDEAYYVSRPNFMNGTSSLGNSFSTVWTGWRRERNPDDPIHTLYFPGWKAYVDGKEAAIQNDRGIIRVPGADAKNVRLRFTETPVRLLADIISILALGGVIFYAYRNRH